MDKIQELLEEYQDSSKDKYHMLQVPDLTKSQRKAIVKEYIKEAKLEDIFESLLQTFQPSKVSKLLIDLYNAKQNDYQQISTKIINALSDALYHYYDDNINERLSDIWWGKEDDRLDSLPSGNDFIARRELLTPYGDPLTLMRE